MDTVGTITATAGYSITDNHSPTAASLTSSIEFAGDHDSSKDISSSSSELFSLNPSHRNPHSLSQRSRQARGKPNQWQQSGSVEDKDLGPSNFPLTDHRANEQLYSVKPQTFDIPQSTDSKSNESVEKSVPSITYGKKMMKNDGHDDRPVFNDWSDEIRMKFENDKSNKSRKRNKYQDNGQEKRKQQNKKLTGSSSENKDGWQEVSPNMEIATGIITSIEHESSQEASASSGILNIIFSLFSCVNTCVKIKN